MKSKNIPIVKNISLAVTIVSFVIFMLLILQSCGAFEGSDFELTCDFCDSHATYSDDGVHYCAKHYRMFHE